MYFLVSRWKREYKKAPSRLETHTWRHQTKVILKVQDERNGPPLTARQDIGCASYLFPTGYLRDAMTYFSNGLGSTLELATNIWFLCPAVKPKSMVNSIKPPLDLGFSSLSPSCGTTLKTQGSYVRYPTFVNPRLNGCFLPENMLLDLTYDSPNQTWRCLHQFLC